MIRVMAPAQMSVLQQVAHLSRRAGFGTTPEELTAHAAAGLAAAVDYYVEYERMRNTVPLAEPKVNDDPNNADISPLQIWWLDRMIRSPRQLEEKMTLFWHGLFATSEDKVDRPTYMYWQNLKFRTHALGDFQELLTEMWADHAMLSWLDGDGSTKDAPNENFGREIMELFSIGVGNYTQADVRAAARAFTGYYIDDKYVRHFDAGNHDNGVKTFLGNTGKWTGTDITRILANHPACGRFLAKKLWQFFAYENPESAVIEELAAVYRQSQRNMKEVVRHLFTMPQFYSPQAIGGRVKSPIEYAITAVREFSAKVHVSDINDNLWGMGQSPFYPPNVGGWPSGTRWISSETVVARFSFAEWLLGQDSDPKKNHVNVGQLLKRYDAGHWPGTLEKLAAYHLAANVAPATTQALQRYTGNGTTRGDQTPATFEASLHLLMVSPEYYCA